MSKHFWIDRKGATEFEDWNVSRSTFEWTLAVIAEHVQDSELSEQLKVTLTKGYGEIALSYFTEEQAAEIVRVIMGPLVAATQDREPELRVMIDDLVDMARRWSEHRSS